jgi:signal transduction histidine kinase
MFAFVFAAPPPAALKAALKADHLSPVTPPLVQPQPVPLPATPAPSLAWRVVLPFVLFSALWFAAWCVLFVARPSPVWAYADERTLNEALDALAFVLVSSLLLYGLVQNVLNRQRLALALQQTQTAEQVVAAQNQAHQQLTEVMARIGDGFLALDNNRCITFLNPHATRLLQRGSGDNLLGKHLLVEFAHVRGTPFHQAIEYAFNTGQPVLDAAYTTPHGRLFEGRIYPSGTGVSIYFTDVTLRHRADTTLRTSELRYRLATAPGHVWEWDLRSNQVLFADHFWLLFDMPVPPGDEAGHLFQAMLHPDDEARWLQMLRDHLSLRTPYVMDYRAHRVGPPTQAMLKGLTDEVNSSPTATAPVANNEWRWFQTQGQAMWDHNGRATFMAGTTFEITARKQAEAALLQLQTELSDLARRLMEQEQTTTRRLAQSLHDQLGQTLAVARLKLDACMANHAAQMPHTLQVQAQEISQTIDRAVHEVRQVLADLRPPLLEAHGLADALENEIASGAAAGSGRVDVLLEVAEEATGLRWPPDVEHAAFMVAREAVANALQHASATLVRVVLSGCGQGLRLQVVDDGVGFSLPLGTPRGAHLGMVGMRERCLAIGARFETTNTSAGGACVTLLWQPQATQDTPPKVSAPQVSAPKVSPPKVS